MEIPEVALAPSRQRGATRASDAHIKPRFEFLAGRPWLALVALLTVAAALMTFLLSFIPLARFIPGAAIILIGLGMAARDGILLGLAMFVRCGGLWMLAAFAFG